MDGSGLETNASAVEHLDINDGPDADKISKRRASPARVVVLGRIPKCRSGMRFPRSLLLRPSLPPADLTTALLAEIESWTISVDAGRAAAAAAVTARFGVRAIRIRTQLLLAATLALKERAARATVRTDAVAG